MQNFIKNKQHDQQKLSPSKQFPQKFFFCFCWARTDGQLDLCKAIKQILGGCAHQYQLPTSQVLRC